jgi:hypothetical protein
MSITNRTLRVILIPPVQPLAPGNFPDKTANQTYDSYQLLIIYPFFSYALLRLKITISPSIFRPLLPLMQNAPAGPVSGRLPRGAQGLMKDAAQRGPGSGEFVQFH